MNDGTIRILKGYVSEAEKNRRAEMVGMLRRCPIPDEELLSNLCLFLNRQELSRILFLREIYERILSVQGIVMEFGVRWGRNLALFSSLRGMYEPYNYSRRIVGFDTFCGFPSIHPKDGRAPAVATGAYSVTEGYEQLLEQVLTYHESESPLPHIRKYQLVKGDATETLTGYLEVHPETIIALAYFDFDLYEPTRKCLEKIAPHLTKGSVIGFDQLNYPDLPGETLALKEVWGLNRYALRRSPLDPTTSYLVVE